MTYPHPMLESEALDVSMWLHYGAAIAAIVSGGILGFLVPLVMSFIAGSAAQRGEYYSIKLAIPFVR